jgi:hypothetical protein
MQFLKQLILFLATVLLVSCEKDLPELNLPEKSTSGRNTLGCLVNGKVWTNYGRRCTLFGGCDEANLTAEYGRSSRGPYLIIHANYTVKKRKSVVAQSFRIVGYNITTPGLYDLADENDVNGGMYFHADDRSLIYRSRTGSAFINITRLDTINQIVSGEFYGELKQFDTTLTAVRVQEGRFDIRLNEFR